MIPHDQHTIRSFVRRRTRREQRRGISLLEVLVSIGVLSIGLLGILALMPAASQQTKAGSDQDAASVMARRAFREMNVRFYGIANAIVSPPARANYFCVDPIGIALATSPGARASLAGVVNAARVTINDPQTNTPYTDLRALDEIFRTPDDLDFGTRASRVATENEAPNPPQQVALKNNASTPVKRNTRGELSWFATVVPRATGFNTVSIAIVRKRGSDELSLSATSVDMSDGIGEISVPNSTIPAWADVKAGHWLLLAGEQSAEWYRVISNGGNATDRSFTVAGPDWLDTGAVRRVILVPNTVEVYSRSLPAIQ